MIGGPGLAELAAYEERVRDLAASQVAPHAALIDRDERVPDQVLRTLAEAGVFASGFPPALGGPPEDEGEPVAAAVRHGLLHEALGAASASVQGLVNVHHMAGSAIARWGTREQKEEWVPKLTSGELLAAIAVTEQNVGSDAAAVETRAVLDGSDWVLRGEKRWITGARTAGLFVVLAGSEGGPLALLLPRATPGLSIEPIRGALGCRGYALGKLDLDGCRLGAEHMLGRPMFGLSHVVATGLEAGRLNLAWGCVGLARACRDAAIDYSLGRRQFGSALSEHQLIRRMVSRMTADVEAARLLCWQASSLRGNGDPAAIRQAALAKYFASTMVNRVANDAVQIHGANGCGPDYPVERYLRDARIMEIIEGTTQILEIAIAAYCYQERS